MGAFAMARVGQQAPDFETLALVGEDFKTLKLSDYKGKYLVLFFYPLDFTFVAPPRSSLSVTALRSSTISVASLSVLPSTLTSPILPGSTPLAWKEVWEVL